MNDESHARGGETVTILSRMTPWEANLVLNMRLWFDGPEGQEQVWSEYRRALPGADAQRECRTFERLLITLTENACRPLVRHHVGCACVGVDEGVFVTLVRTASEGYLSDAALIATLLTRPAHAELIAVMAGQVGHCVRQIHNRRPEYEMEHRVVSRQLH